MQKVLLSFADSSLRPSAKRIARQARLLNVYQRVIVADEFCLDIKFRERFKAHLVPGTRGYGYWVWKPQIIMQTLQELGEGDVLLYVDVGCHLNPKGNPRLLEYFALAGKATTGILAFQAKPPEPPLPYDGRPLLNLPDGAWVKGDLLDYFGIRANEELLQSPTIGAGLILFRKTAPTIRFIADWSAVAERNFALLDDSPSETPNRSEFIEHRHDQAIFSVLCKLGNVETLSAYEYWYPTADGTTSDWDILSNFPVHARRDKVPRLRSRLAGKIRNIMRQLRNLTIKQSVRH